MRRSAAAEARRAPATGTAEGTAPRLAQRAGRATRGSLPSDQPPRARAEPGLRTPELGAWESRCGPNVRMRPEGLQMTPSPPVGLIMGSQSDWATLPHAAATLDELAVAHEDRIVSAHRTPERLVEYATTAKERGLKVIIAGAGQWVTPSGGGSPSVRVTTVSTTALDNGGTSVDTSKYIGISLFRRCVNPKIWTSLWCSGDN
jgi:AIR carboxylase